MEKERLLAFSDAFIAIAITIMVLELKAPHGTDWVSIQGLIPTFFSYVLSFVYVGIYWNNHHHMLHTATRVNGAILWANTHLLFWLSLIPFATAWMGENHFVALPTAVYGFVLLMAAIAYYILERAIIRHEGPHSTLAKAVGKDVKGKISPLLYLGAIMIAFKSPLLATLIYAGVALLWLVPDRRIEKMLEKKR